MFTDDTAILVQGDTWDEGIIKARLNLCITKKWFDQNMLSLNLDKTEFMSIALSGRGDIDVWEIVIHECGMFIAAHVQANISYK